jgi:hypothetical protein
VQVLTGSVPPAGPEFRALSGAAASRVAVLVDESKRDWVTERSCSCAGHEEFVLDAGEAAEFSA